MLLAVVFALPAHAEGAFAIKDGDRIVFYGDSITAREIYTAYVETYIITRFPAYNVSFVNAGVDNEEVKGGMMGTADERLQRDVFDFKPTVVTVMLGMNDAVNRGGRPLDQEGLDNFAKGYSRLLTLMKAGVPDARLVLMAPSPYDDVTRAPGFEAGYGKGGYNQVLEYYAAFIKAKSPEIGATYVDLNTPLVETLRKAKEIEPSKADDLMPDRIHPRAVLGMVMAAEILKAWNAPALVSAVELDAASASVVRQDNAVIDKLFARAGTFEWTQRDFVLPMPMQLSNPRMALVAKSSDVVKALNQHTLKVSGLKAPYYELRIDGGRVALLSAQQLAGGVNLAWYDTPMLFQAQSVYELTVKCGLMHSEMMDMLANAEDESSVAAEFTRMKDAYLEVYNKRKVAIKPRPHTFVLQPATPPKN